MAYSLSLDKFYAPYYEVTGLEETERGIIIDLRSTAKSARCPYCEKESTRIKETYRRKDIQDFSIFNSSAFLHVTCSQFACENPKCPVRTFAENTNPIIGNRSHLTSRLETFVAAIVANCSAEAAEAILKLMHVEISAETINHILLRSITSKKYEGYAIGIDEFAGKKGVTYFTMICDLTTHEVLDVFDGRDEAGVLDWLHRHPNIWFVTRDRSSSYASAVSKACPGAIQVADRFHLFQNLHERLRESLNEILPETICISDRRWSKEAITLVNKQCKALAPCSQPTEESPRPTADDLKIVDNSEHPDDQIAGKKNRRREGRKGRRATGTHPCSS